ncbi:chemotaxis protein CheA [Clostridium tunisiense]|uniref:chemotaxis protein CheA n=1 Tax=Clostridium tunisiense TaxID=219748 RepID=UPI0003153450|nr:chemotaxis protein CheA [Clostridium tunisiense]
MDTSQYLSMFLEESSDNLQTLNECLLALENEPGDMEKLNEIFRVAHTIKGMAATMGYSKMAELTHKMEDVLSNFREGKVKVTHKVVTVLFKCLDTLEAMVDSITQGNDGNMPIEEIVSHLEGIANGTEEGIESSTVKTNINETIDKSVQTVTEETGIVLNEYELNIIKQAKHSNVSAYHIHVTLDEGTILKSARAFVLFQALEQNGEIIKSIPALEDLETENFDFDIDLVYLSSKTLEEIQGEINGISEISKVEVSSLNNGVKIAVKTEEHKANTDSAPSVKNLKAKEVVVDEKIAKKTSDTTEIKTKTIEQPAPVAQDKKVKSKGIGQSVRVDLERLDKFMNMVSELVIHRTRLEQISSNHKIAELNETLEQVARATTDLQDLVMKIRMLPLDVVFNRFPRMIRDLSLELGKEIELIIQGQDTELDRTVIEEIGEPLIHLLRNAADHGIEATEERVAKGKNPVGKVKLIAYSEGTKAVIKVEDDGKGLDVNKIKAKAEKIGISTEGMSEADIKNLIFAQGFSTNEVVTDISGRGVGMDVVKTKISSLGGTVDAISEAGKGTSFIIRLPLTLQIIQALLVKVGTETMAISLGFIDRVIEYKEENIRKTNNKEVVLYNGNVISIVRVNNKLGIESVDQGKKYIILVKVGEREMGLVVDSLLGQQEIVIKPFGKTLKSTKEYIGATILGDGLVTLILDVAALI